MAFQHIENLQQEYTDKYVVVNEELPELQRFHGMTGVVRTVNMNGRALVEFDGDNNIGWYDIDIDFLRVIDEPLPEEIPAEEPAVEKIEEKEDKAPSDLKKARDEKGDGEMSVDEILAAAKNDTESEPAVEVVDKPAAADASAMSVDDMLAAARGEASGTVAEEEAVGEEDATEEPTVAADASAMSVDDMLAAARGEASGTVAEEEAGVEEDATEAVEEPATEEVEQQAASSGELPTDVDGMIAYCQRVDGDG